MSNSLNLIALKLHEFITGRKILVRLEELNRSQWLSKDELLALQRNKLQQLLDYSYRYVPYYHNLFDKIGFQPEELTRNPESFRELPILTKSIIRENWDALLTTEPERRKGLRKLATSGSTGQPLVFMQDSDFRDSVTADIQRHLGWAGCKVGDLHAMIWGAPRNPTRKQELQLAIIDRIWNRFQLDAFRLTVENLQAFTTKVKRKSPKIIFGYATSLYHFAQFVRQSSVKGITFQGIFTTSELLLPNVRQFIEETFGCKVFDRYGTLDLGGIACECEMHDGLHISMENNYIEILKNGIPANEGQLGDLIITNLNNKGMPFIRYSIGDESSWKDTQSCSCGRSSLMLNKVEGRLVDSFYTSDGRSVWSGFAGSGFRCLTHPSINQFQVVQKSLNKMIIRLELNQAIAQTAIDEIIKACKSAYGDNITVDFEFMDKIPTLPSGKHAYAISEINKNSNS